MEGVGLAMSVDADDPMDVDELERAEFQVELAKKAPMKIRTSILRRNPLPIAPPQQVSDDGERCTQTRAKGAERV